MSVKGLEEVPSEFPSATFPTLIRRFGLGVLLGQRVAGESRIGVTGETEPEEPWTTSPAVSRAKGSERSEGDDLFGGCRIGDEHEAILCQIDTARRYERVPHGSGEDINNRPQG